MSQRTNFSSVVWKTKGYLLFGILASSVQLQLIDKI